MKYGPGKLGDMPKIIIVSHSQSGNTEHAAGIVAEGARTVEGVEVLSKPALEATADDLLECDGIGIGTPDYFSYMAGGLKDFFDRTFYPTKGQVVDKPCVIFVTHGGGGTPAAKSVQSICRSFKFKQVTEPVLVRGRPDESSKESLIELGRSLAEACTS